MLGSVAEALRGACLVEASWAASGDLPAVARPDDRSEPAVQSVDSEVDSRQVDLQGAGSAADDWAELPQDARSRSDSQADMWVDSQAGSPVHSSADSPVELQDGPCSPQSVSRACPEALASRRVETQAH